MIHVSVADLVARTINSAATLYMLLILLRWVAPWLRIDTFDRRIRWAWRLTDPLIDAMRRMLPPMGPFDFGPVAALFVVWIVRAIAVQAF